MEDKPEYITDAEEMIGKGYDAAVIEQPRKRLVLRDGIGEEWTVAWVKMSTAFKPHIKELRGSPLAVWLYICLSINEKGVAFPGIRTIAEDTGYSHQGVLDAIKILEEKGYLHVRRGERRYNLYEPEFAAIGKTNEPSGTVKLVESTFMNGQLVGSNESTFPLNESTPLDLNKKNKKEQDNKILGIEASIMQGRPTTQEDIDPAKVQHDALAAFEVAFKLDPGNIAWFNQKPEWTRLRKKLVEKYLTDAEYFKKYHKWYTEEGKFAGGMNVQQMRRDPDGFVLALNIFESATIGEKTQKTGRRLERLDR